MKTFPTLFQRTNTGAIQQWTVIVDGNAIVVEWGQVDGAIQRTTTTIREGKNLGKKNATTPAQQAEAEAQAKWTKKIQREGYVTDRARAERGERDAEGGLAVMLAPSKLQEKHLKFPLDVQPKFDGVRCVVIIQDGEVSLWSRRREQMKCLPHIEQAYREAYAGIPGLFIFDGEAYRHGWLLQKIATFVRKKNEARPGYEEIGHFVYDMPSAEGTWEQRREALAAAVLPESPHVHRVETARVSTLEEAWAWHDVKVEEGYEGAMARNLDGEYEEDRRSPNLNKLKVFEDHEFTIVGVEEGVGKFEGKAIFICEITGKDPSMPGNSAATFRCTAPGTMKDKEEFLRNFETYRGGKLTVKHKGWTADGLPWHPTGKAVRDYE